MDGKHCKAIIMDLGDVLFTWSASTKTNISGATLRRILKTKTWFEYECGLIPEAVCYARVAEQFSLLPTEVAEAFSQARASLQANDAMVEALHELKAASKHSVRVYAMSNISKEDYAVLSQRTADWAIFDHIFISGEARMRKPSLKFFKHVLEATQTEAKDAIFVDDKVENVVAARSIGIQGIIFDDTGNVARTLRNLLGDSVERGKEFLKRNAGKMYSVTRSGVTIRDNFAQLMILDATEDLSLVDLKASARNWNFFDGKPVLTTDSFPDDLDTTSSALLALDYPPEVIHSIMDEMLQYTDEDGIIMTYFTHTRPRTDPIVCTKILHLFHLHGRGDQLAPTLFYIRAVLFHRAYLDGTLYYTSPETFLYAVSRLLSVPYLPALHDALSPLLMERLQERVQVEGDALSLAMRVLACRNVGVGCEGDLGKLRGMQGADGGWEGGGMYRYGATGVEIGNRGVVTALAVRALEGVR